MKKPQPKAVKPQKALNYLECRDYIEKKYKIDVRDYAGKFSVPGRAMDNKIPYQDFWHWLIGRCDIDHNGCFIDMPTSAPNADQWVQEILALFTKEFATKDQESIEFWVEW